MFEKIITKKFVSEGISSVIYVILSQFRPLPAFMNYFPKVSTALLYTVPLRFIVDEGYCLQKFRLHPSHKAFCSEYCKWTLLLNWMHFTCALWISKTRFKSETTNKKTPVPAAQLSASITLPLSVNKPTHLEFLFFYAWEQDNLMWALRVPKRCSWGFRSSRIFRSV